MAGKRLARGTGHHLTGPVSGGRRRHLSTEADAWNRTDQAGIALEGLARQWPLALDSFQQFVDIGRYRADIALDLIALDVAFDQHHPHHALVEALLWQEGVGQQVSVVAVTLSDAPRDLDQFAKASLTTNQRLVDLGQFLQRVDAAALDLHLPYHHPGAHHQLLVGSRFRYLQIRPLGPI